MGIYSNGGEVINENLTDTAPLLEAFIYDELSALSDEDKQKFVNSEDAKNMLEAGLITRKTLVRLTKQDDMSRRTTMACFHMAKEANDPLWEMLRKNRVKERDLIAKIERKYSARAGKVAKIGQKAYLKQKMPLAFMKPSGVH